MLRISRADVCILLTFGHCSPVTECASVSLSLCYRESAELCCRLCHYCRE